MYRVTKELLEYEQRALTRMQCQLQQMSKQLDVTVTPEYRHYQERSCAFKRDTLRFQKGI